MTAPAGRAAATPCGACGATGARPWHRREGYDYVRCVGCGTVHLSPMPDDGETAPLYGAGYFRGGDAAGYTDYEADADIHRRNARRHLDRLEALGSAAPGRLIEVGCAAGYLLEEAATRGWEAYGVDISAEMRAATRDRLGIEVASRLDALGVEARSVDVIVMNQVLEHMSDPLHQLTVAAQLLAPGGRLSIETWDRESAVARLFGSRWQQITPPWVLWLFGRSDLRRLVAASGLEVEHLRWTSKLVSLDTVAGQLAARGRMGRLLATATGAVGLRRRALRYGAGDLVVVVARRRTEPTGAGRATRPPSSRGDIPIRRDPQDHGARVCGRNE